MIYKKTIIGTIGYLGGLPALLESFCWSWGQMIQYNTEYLCDPAKGEIVHYEKATVSLHFFARNDLACKMKGGWLLMMDTDHAPEPDIAVRMVHAMNKYDLSVVTALYRHRAAPGCPVIYQWDEQDRFALPIGNWDQTVSALRIGSAGGGCLMIRRSVFERIERELKESPFDQIPGYGEDHSFFRRCKQLNIPVYALTKVESPHLQITKLRMEDYNFEHSAISDRQDAVGYT